MRFALTMVTAIICSTLALPVVAEVTLGIALGTADSVETINYDCDAGDPMRVQYVNTGQDSLALLKIDGAQRIFVNVTSGSGARYVSGADVWSTKGTAGILENTLNETNLQCEQSDGAKLQ